MENTPDETDWNTDEGSGSSPISSSRLAPAALASRIEDALSTSSRTEAALADLFRTAQFLCATVSAVCRTNGELARELSALREMIAEGDHTIDLCAQSLDHVDEEAPHEALPRRELIAEHDQFIAMLLADHERELAALREKLNETRASLES